MVVFPNAKINLGLNIIEKRKDGYHNIESCFYPVAWNDILEIIPDQSTVKFKSTGIDIPGSEVNNLCLKAYHMLKEDFNIPAVHIHLHKQIPIGAGLGGGSSDGAFTLKTLNELYGLGLRNEELESYAGRLGSDCPFFIKNRPVYCFGKGDEFKNIEVNLKNHWITLIYPKIHCSTQEAYAKVKPQYPEINCKDLLENNPLTTWKNLLKNDFEYSIFSLYPEIETLKNYLYQLGALYASMSGSGSTVFGIFKNKPHFSSEFGKKHEIKTLKLSDNV